MSSPIRRPVVLVVATLAFSLIATAQTSPAQSTQTQAQQRQSNRPAITVFDKISDDPGGPAPKHDITGVWAGPIGSGSRNVPPMTPLGQKMYSLNKPESKFSLAGTNDPFGLCDPLGIPRKLMDQTRGMIMTPMSDRMLQAWQYGSVWRQIWTDGRALPKDVGGDSPDSPDPRWWGYSVGHWDGDYTFVVDTVGVDDRTWLDKVGHPHSVGMHVEERYTRLDHNHLQLKVTVDDPTVYTKPFEVSTTTFRWSPQQDFEEQFCVPSEETAYSQLIGKAAGDGSTSKK